jgi:carbohydrate kinase (thermoresistant glucokinase family)
MVIVVLGPMGCGKTTIGTLLAEKLGWNFADADDYHPEVNKIKMGSGVPLNDSDREPWLAILKSLIDDHLHKDQGLVLACSALKEKYRDLLGIDNNDVHSVFLKGSLPLLEERLKARSHEYMSNTLLQSQLDTLEEPQSGCVVDIDDSPEGICQKIIKKLIS